MGRSNNIKFHPAASVFPLLEGDELKKMAADIAVRGLQMPIELLDGKIIDGRNRYRACKIAGIEPKFVHVEHGPNDSPIDYVLSLNLHRRHLTASQRAMVAARIKEHYAEAAKERQLSKLKQNTVVDNCPEREGQARDQARKSVGVSGKSVDRAEKVQTKGDPELIKAVENGRVPVASAAKLAELSKQAQRAAVRSGNPKRAAQEAIKKAEFDAQWKLERAKAKKALEAAMRHVDGIHRQKPNTIHKEIISGIKRIWKEVDQWK